MHYKPVSFIFLMWKGYLHCTIRYSYNYFRAENGKKTQDNYNYECNALFYTS